MINITETNKSKNNAILKKIFAAFIYGMTASSGIFCILFAMDVNSLGSALIVLAVTTFLSITYDFVLKPWR